MGYDIDDDHHQSFQNREREENHDALRELRNLPPARTNHFGVDIENIQGEAFRWSERNKLKQDDVLMFLGVVEEVGELAHFMLKERQGIREGSDGAGKHASTEAHQMDAVGDIAIFLIQFCSMKGWSFGRILADTWEQVSKRDFVRFPKNGLTE